MRNVKLKVLAALAAAATLQCTDGAVTPRDVRYWADWPQRISYNGHDPCWGADDRILLCGSNPHEMGDALFTIDPQGGSRAFIFLTESVRVEDAVWSPDGRRIAFDDRVETFQFSDLFILELDRGRVTRVTESGGVSPAWSPDGREIAFVAPGAEYYDRYGALKVVDPATGKIRTVADVVDARDPTWSPDGRTIAFGRGRTPYGRGEIWQTTLTGEMTCLISDPAISYDQPAWSPDGKYLAVRSSAGDPGEIAVWEKRTGKITVRTDRKVCQEPAWAPDGGDIVFRAANYGGRAGGILVMEVR
jgi:Tol biopolymer transport system component